MPIPSSVPLAPEFALRQARLIWGALLAGQVAFLGVAAFLLNSPANGPRDPAAARPMLFVAFALLVTLVPGGFLMRRRALARAGESGAIDPRLFLRATIAALALCEAASFAGIVTAILQGALLPGMFVTLVALAAQALQFPRAEDLAGNG